jgi:hypothetical protein
MHTSPLDACTILVSDGRTTTMGRRRMRPLLFRSDRGECLPIPESLMESSLLNVEVLNVRDGEGSIGRKPP